MVVALRLVLFLPVFFAAWLSALVLCEAVMPIDMNSTSQTGIKSAIMKP